MRAENQRWRGQAIRMALALYPRHVRERYGAEVAELLRSSPTLGRDLTNVAVCAAAEHGGTISMSNVGRSSARVAGLVAIPFGVIVLWVIGWLVTNELMQAGLEAWYSVVVIAVPALLAVPVAVWLAILHRRRSRVARPALVVPTAFALGLFIIASIPGSGSTPWQVWTGQDYWPGPNTMIGERWDGTSVAVALWLIGMLLIGLLPRLHWLAKVALAFAVLDIAIAAYILNTFPPEMKPLSEAILWYPFSVVGHDSDLAGGLLNDTLKLLPQILTVLTVYLMVRTRPVQTVPAY